MFQTQSLEISELILSTTMIWYIILFTLMIWTDHVFMREAVPSI